MDRLAPPEFESKGNAASSFVDLLNYASLVEEEEASSDEEDHLDTIDEPLPPPSIRASTIPRLNRTTSGNIQQLPRPSETSAGNASWGSARADTNGEGKREPIRVDTNFASGGNGAGMGETLSEQRESLVREELELFEGASENVRMNLGGGSKEGSTAEAALSDQEMEKKLTVLQDEFGTWCDDSERFVDQIPAALHRGALLKGVIAITNRRLFFFAYIPQLDAVQVLKSGVATITTEGILHTKRRVWCELRADSFTWYKNSAKLYKPLGACRLSQIKTVFPYNEDHPKSFSLELLDGRIKTPIYDTAEAAIEWRNELEATLFSFRATADRLRLALPLELIHDISISPYFTIAQRVEIQFDAGHDVDDLASSTPSRSDSPSSPASSSASSAASRTTLALGYLSTHDGFAEKLEELVGIAKKNPGVCVMKPILEIDSVTRDEDAKLQNELAADKSLAANFMRAFGLNGTPSDIFVAPSCELIRTLPAWGALAISINYLCFWRKSLYGDDIMLKVPLVDLDDVKKVKAFGFRIFGLEITVHGAADIRLDFVSRALRDETLLRIQQKIIGIKAARLDLVSTPPSSRPDSPIGSPSTVLGQTIEESVKVKVSGRKPITAKLLNVSDGRAGLESLHFVLMTIGSRGDVQPLIVLGIELMKDGHTVTIASHPEYRGWAEGYGLGYREIGGDPSVLMELNVKHKIFSPGFFSESVGKFRGWLDELFLECWAASEGADVIIESPVTFAGIHCAEARGVPYFRIFTMPWTSTSVYPQAFAAAVDLGPSYNLLSYSLFQTIMWKATAGQINRFRKKTLGLRSTNLAMMSEAKIPYIYNFSPSVVPKPNDWKDFICVAGYFFLDTPAKELEKGLMDFITKAREDGKKIVYVGFGSIVVPDSVGMTKAVIAAGAAADVRVILTKGWSDRMNKSTEIVEIPPEVYCVDSVPHDRLFPLIDAACHHGGAGSTGASLRAGLPTLIHPFFGDQFFYASRMQKLGVGMQVSLDAKGLAAAFKAGTTQRIMKEKAEDLGAKIRAEDGPSVAKNFLYTFLNLATETTERRKQRSSGAPSRAFSLPTRSSTLKSVSSLKSILPSCPTTPATPRPS